MRKRELKKNKLTISAVIVMIVLIAYAIMLFGLLAWGIMVSLQAADKASSGAFYQLPFDFQPHYADILLNFAMAGKYGQPIFFENILSNTLIYAIGSAFLKTLVPCLTAYACARFNFKTSKIVYTAILTAMIIPVVGSLPSETKLIYSFQVNGEYLIVDNLIGVCLLKASMTGLYFFVMYASFSSMPKDYFEAAKIDGANNFEMLFKIAFPLIKNVFFTIFIINFVEFWNDYQTPMIYLPTKPTLGYTVFATLNSRITSIDPELTNVFRSQPYLMSIVIISAVPVVTLFLIFKDKFMGSLTMGGIKG